MGARLKIEPHLTQDEIRGYFLTSEDGVEQTRWQVILLLSEGVKSEEVARIVGFCVPWVREIAVRYNREGAAAMRDGRHENPGAAPLLAAALQQELAAAIEQPPRGGRDLERPAGGGLDGAAPGAEGARAARVGVHSAAGVHAPAAETEAPGR